MMCLGIWDSIRFAWSTSPHSIIFLRLESFVSITFQSLKIHLAPSLKQVFTLIKFGLVSGVTVVSPHETWCITFHLDTLFVLLRYTYYQFTITNRLEHGCSIIDRDVHLNLTHFSYFWIVSGHKWSHVYVIAYILMLLFISVKFNPT